MPKYRITGPDGSTYEVTAPDGASEQDVMDYVQRNAGMVRTQPASAEMKPSTPPPVSPRQAEDESMAAYEKFANSPTELSRNALPKSIRGVKDALDAAEHGIAKGLTFNLADEIQGALSTPIELGIGAYNGEDSGKGILDRLNDAYTRGLDKARDTQKLAESRAPIADVVGQVAGGTALGGGLSSNGLTLLNAAKPTIASMATRGAIEGAGYGGAYGFGQGEGTENRFNEAAKQGGLGALTGGTLGALAGRSAQKAADATIPSTQQLKAMGTQAYKDADQAGLVISPQRFSDLVDDIAVKMNMEGIDKTIHPKALAALQRLTEAQGGTPGLQDIDTLRRVVRSAAASTDPSERRLANIMVGKIDDFMNNLTPQDVVAGDALKATSALNKGRDLWSRMRKSEMIDEAVRKAENRAASNGSGGNIDNAIRQNIRSILDNPKKSKGFTSEELDMMKKVVHGGSLQNLTRLVGKLSPEGNGLMMMLHGIGGYATGGSTLPLAAVGFGAKRIADRATPANVEALSRVIRSGGVLPAPQMLPAQQRALLEAAIVNSPKIKGLLDYEQVPVR